MKSRQERSTSCGSTCKRATPVSMAAWATAAARANQRVVHLVGVVRAACCHHSCACLSGGIRQYFGIGIGQGKDNGIGCHGAHHVWCEDAWGRYPNEDICALDRLSEPASSALRVGTSRQFFLDRCHASQARVQDTDTIHQEQLAYAPL